VAICAVKVAQQRNFVGHAVEEHNNRVQSFLFEFFISAKKNSGLSFT